MQEDFMVNLIFLASKGKDECHRFLRTPGKNKMSIEEYSFSQCTLEQVSSFKKLINKIEN